MSDFIAANLHKKVDHIMDVFFGAGVASHPTIIEQINYLLFMRALSQNDDDLRKIGITDSDQLVFDGDLEKYRWDNLLTLNAEQLFIALEDCFRHIPESTTNKTVRLVFRNAHIKLFDKPTLRTVLHEIDAFAKLMDEGEHKGKRDIFGDTYEYLLSKLAQAGTSGQFRTPRHIIEFLVDVVAPKKGETIIDPAVGTAGFLVKAFEYLRREYTSPEQLSSGGAFDKLSSKEHTFLYEHTFSGFDSDEDMIKFGMMNLYLHGLQNARMVRQNTLTETAGSRDKYDVILANPPFAGKVDRDSVAEELQMNTGATEVLFLRYMLRHLTDNGRAGVIVPEGVLFNASGAHIKIRELLLENGLWCVVSLPGGVFNPYAGVKTSILFFDKTRKKRGEILFTKVEHDGFSLTTQRRSIEKNDLPEMLIDIKRYENGEQLQGPSAHVVTYERIKESKDINLSGDRYKLVEMSANHEHKMVELGDILSYEQPTKYIVESVDYDDSYATPVLTAGKTFILGKTDETQGILTDTPVIIFDDFTTATKFVDFPFKVKSSAMKILRVKDNNVADIQYIYRAMQLINFTPNEHKRFWISQYSKLKIPLPPLEVQRKIVTEIENKQKAINHAREIISTLEKERAYFDPSTRAEKENWPIVKLSDVFKSLDTGVSVNSANHPRSGDEHGVLKTSAVTYGIFLPGENKAVLQDELKRAKTNPRKDSIIISRMNTEQLVGASAYINQDYDNLYLPDRLWQASTDRNDVLVQFISFVIAGDPFRRKLSGIASGTSGSMKNISQKAFLGLEIPLPPIDTQKQITAEFTEEQKIVESNQKLIDIYEGKIQDLIANI